jgi:hypothetical protein
LPLWNAQGCIEKTLYHVIDTSHGIAYDSPEFNLKLLEQYPKYCRTSTSNSNATTSNSTNMREALIELTRLLSWMSGYNDDDNDNEDHVDDVAIEGKEEDRSGQKRPRRETTEDDEMIVKFPRIESTLIIGTTTRSSHYTSTGQDTTSKVQPPRRDEEIMTTMTAATATTTAATATTVAFASHGSTLQSHASGTVTDSLGTPPTMNPPLTPAVTQNGTHTNMHNDNPTNHNNNNNNNNNNDHNAMDTTETTLTEPLGTANKTSENGRTGNHAAGNGQHKEHTIADGADSIIQEDTRQHDKITTTVDGGIPPRTPHEDDRQETPPNNVHADTNQIFQTPAERTRHKVTVAAAATAAATTVADAAAATAATAIPEKTPNTTSSKQTLTPISILKPNKKPVENETRIPSWKAIKPILESIGHSFYGNRYCRPNGDPRTNKNAKVNVDYFTSLAEYRDYLCVHGVDYPKDVVDDWALSDKETMVEMIEFWVRYHIVTKVDSKSKAEKRIHHYKISKADALKLMKTAGVLKKKGYNWVIVKTGQLCPDEWPVWDYLGRHGIPEECKPNMEESTLTALEILIADTFVVEDHDTL